MTPLVSIIMPAFNSSLYIREAIESVLNQTYENWELLIVNDGSTDNTENVIAKFKDKRITYTFQQNAGVSAARNTALKQMKGDLFCFLDADDIFPIHSISSRVAKFQSNKDLSFVDGKVLSKSENLSTSISTYIPSFRGEPLKELVRLKSTCLLGNTWMIKKEASISYQFTEGLTHAEDLSFYLSICDGKQYDFVTDEILWYRRSDSSAMSNLSGLEKGYLHVYQISKNLPITHADRSYLKKRILRIMFLSWLMDGKNPIQAILSFFRIVSI